MRRLLILAAAALFATPAAAASVLPVVQGIQGPQESLPVVATRLLPAGAVAVTGSSGNVAAASAVATLAGVAAKTTFISGFQCTPGGATGAALVDVTVAGVITGTMTYTMGAPAGATLMGTPLVVTFNPPVPASAANTAIVVTMPSLGTGNAHAACSAQGYQL